MLARPGMVMQAGSCGGIHQQRVINREWVLIAEHDLAHSVGVAAACRSSTVGGGKPLQFGALAMSRRAAGTSPVVACTRAFATSRSHRKTAALDACLSAVSPSCRIEATNGTQKLPLR